MTAVSRETLGQSERQIRDSTLVGLFAATVFLSAFLLFQVQPMIGKVILPWFGSTPGVWATTLLFFQLILLAGYAYAHFVVIRLSWHRQAIVHATLLALVLITLPIAPAEALKPTGPDAPASRLLLILTLSVGRPVLPALCHHSSATALVRCSASWQITLPFLRPLQCWLIARATLLSLRRRTLGSSPDPDLDLVPGLCRVCRTVCSVWMAALSFLGRHGTNPRKY